MTEGALLSNQLPVVEPIINDPPTVNNGDVLIQEAIQKNGSDEMEVDSKQETTPPKSLQIEVKDIDLESARREESLGNIEKMQREFNTLKEQLYKDKLTSFKKEILAIKNGTHEDFLEKVKELEGIKNEKIWSAEQWKNYQVQSFQHAFSSEKKQAEEEFKADKKELREKMINTILEKKRKLTEEKSTLNLTEGSDIPVNTRLRTRRQSTHQILKKKEPTLPDILYTLNDSEILEDITAIQKGLIAEQSVAVSVERGALVYKGQPFEKGRDVLIESTGSNHKWHGVIVNINPSEIHLKSVDGSKSRFSLSQMRNGKYSIVTAN